MKTILITIAIVFSGMLMQAQVKVGDTLQGGIVFYVDQSVKSGLVAARHDQTTKKIKWGNNSNTQARSLDDGYDNTIKIIQHFEKKASQKAMENTAAYKCSSLDLNGHNDWYLPAIDELTLMYNNKYAIGGFKHEDYCSSTEYRRKDAYSIHFRPHKRVEYYYNKNDKDYFVRCIRKFNIDEDTRINDLVIEDHP